MYVPVHILKRGPSIRHRAIDVVRDHLRLATGSRVGRLRVGRLGDVVAAGDVAQPVELLVVLRLRCLQRLELLPPLQRSLELRRCLFDVVRVGAQELLQDQLGVEGRAGVEFDSVDLIVGRLLEKRGERLTESRQRVVGGQLRPLGCCIVALVRDMVGC